MVDRIRLYGRIFLEMDIRAVTGLRIGGNPPALAIGDIDNPVIRDPLTLRPYIPGSSLRGKMRSLWEKATGADQNTSIGKDVRIHSLNKNSSITEYERDSVCRIFGVTGDVPVPNPTRLIVHDTTLSDVSADDLERAETTLFTETKWEAAIDRITSAATPRQMERVPAGALFDDCRLVYSIYNTQTPDLDGDEFDWFGNLIEILQMVEDDYLGSSGSRGSGRVAFENLRLGIRTTDTYMNYVEVISKSEPYPTVDSLWNVMGDIKGFLRDQFGAVMS
jgi:CRISPR-associated protein Csm3